MSCVVITYLYGSFECIFLSCMPFRVNPHPIAASVKKKSFLKTGVTSEVEMTATRLNPQPISL